MKKRMLLFFILCFLVIVFVFYESKKSYDNYEVKIIENFNLNEQNDLKVCLLNKDKQLEIVNIKVDKGIDKISHIIKLFDEHRNSLPLEYSTVLFDNLNIKNLRRDNEKLYLEIEKLSQKTNLDSFLTALMWSYKYLGIKEIEVKISGTVYKINDQIKINTLYLSTKPSSLSTYYELTDNGVIPYSIIHDMDEIELFLKMAGIYNESSYNIKKTEEEVFLYFDNKFQEVTDEMIQEIYYNIDLLDSYKNVNIYLNNNLIDN